MISQITTELIKGVVKKVQLITYNNGLRKKRVFANMHDVVPEEVITLGFTRRPIRLPRLKGKGA